jgi:hypothetical protein
MSELDFPGIEGQLFTWKTWDEGDCKCMIFGDVILKVQIGQFPA